MNVIKNLRMRMNVTPPGGDLAMEIRYTIDDRHRNGSSLLTGLGRTSTHALMSL
jgi:hypothetical protein